MDIDTSSQETDNKEVTRHADITEDKTDVDGGAEEGKEETVNSRGKVVIGAGEGMGFCKPGEDCGDYD